MQSSNFTCCFNHPLILIQLMSKDSYMVLWLCWPNSGMRSLHKLKENWGSSSWVFVHSLGPGNWVECTHVYSHTNGPRHSLFITYSPAVICSCVTKSACQSTLRNLIPHADCEQREQSSFVSWEARGVIDPSLVPRGKWMVWVGVGCWGLRSRTRKCLTPSYFGTLWHAPNFSLLPLVLAGI